MRTHTSSLRMHAHAHTPKTLTQKLIIKNEENKKSNNLACF